MIHYNNGIPQGSKTIPDAVQPDAEPGPKENGPTTTPDNGIRGQHNILRKIERRSGDHLGQGPKDEGIRPGSKQEINANGNKRPRETTDEPADADDSGQHEIPGDSPDEEDDQKRGNKEGRQRCNKRSEDHSGKKEHAHNKPSETNGGNKQDMGADEQNGDTRDTVRVHNPGREQQP